MNVAVILAGGIGSRVGANIPKQFIEVMGKPILVYTIEKFQNNKNIDAIEVVCIESYKETLNELVKDYSLDKVKWIANGGKDFQHSVLNGIRYLEQYINNDDNVIIHFGASPFVTDEIIDDSIKICNIRGNAISTTPFYILSGWKDNDYMSTKYINRDSIACMNSPHTFKYKLIKDIYKRAIDLQIIDKVEPHTTTLMYELKEPIYFSKGSQTNIKITTKEDLDLFEGYVLLQNKRKGN